MEDSLEILSNMVLINYEEALEIGSLLEERHKELH